MKSASPALLALLDANQFDMADLFTLTTLSGTVVRHTDYDMDLSVARFTVTHGNYQLTGHEVFSASGPIFSRGKTKLCTGMEVDELDVTVAARLTDLLMGTPWLQVAHNGGLDGARIKLERAIMSAPGDCSAGAVFLFEGRVSEIEVKRNEAQIKVKSDLELLNVKMPRNVYQPGCLNDWGDRGCSVNKVSYAVAGSVTGTPATTGFQTGLAQADGYFDQGTILFTCGANVGVQRSVKAWRNGGVSFSYPLRTAPAVGDTFTIYPGCDGTQATCKTRFDNLGRFRGFPYIPVVETAL